jgi:hypothetical protein
MRIEIDDNNVEVSAECALCGTWEAVRGRVGALYDDAGQYMGLVCARCFDAGPEELHYRMLANGQHLRSLAQAYLERAASLEAAGPIEKPAAVNKVLRFPAARVPWVVAKDDEDMPEDTPF